MNDIEKGMSPAKIREATSEDVGALVELWIKQHDYHVALDNQYYEPTGAENVQDAKEYFTKAVERGDLKILLAIDEAGIIGFITFKKVSRSQGIARSGARIKDYGEVEDLFVESSLRGKGIGKQLINKAQDWFVAQGVKYMMVEVSAPNEATINFYEKSGFQTQQVEMFKEI